MVCHIFPFSATKRRPVVGNALSGVLQVFWDDGAYAQRLQALLVNDDHIIDSVRNMICLNPVLHQWWGKGYFALEPFERIENGTRVRLRWLKQSPFTVYDKVENLATDPRHLLRSPQEEGVVAMRDFASGHPLLDGAIFDLTSGRPENEVSYDLLKLQWDLLRMTALSGAGEAADDPSWRPDEDMPELEED